MLVCWLVGCQNYQIYWIFSSATAAQQLINDAFEDWRDDNYVGEWKLWWNIGGDDGYGGFSIVGDEDDDGDDGGEENDEDDDGDANDFDLRDFGMSPPCQTRRLI